MGTLCIERRRVPYRTVHAIQRSGHQFKRHEGIVRAGERSGNTKGPGLGETEPGIITRVAHHDHRTVPEIAAGLESFLHECRSDALALVRWVHAKRCKCAGGYTPLVEIS